MKKAKRRLLLCTLVLIAVVSSLAASLYSYWVQIAENKRQAKILTSELSDLMDKEDDLKDEILKLQDPDYVARYAKEKYLYSAEGDVIIKIVK